MQPNEKNKALHRGIDAEFIRGVAIYDIDTTIYEYMVNSVVPTLKQPDDGRIINIPVLYGNAERWVGARKQGYLRDVRGQLQIPLIMFKRNSIERNSSLPQFKEVNTMPAFKKYSAKNRYERFSLQNNTSKVYEQYHVSVPDYVTFSYEVMAWASFTEHMNTIVEAFQYASDRYWGVDGGYKFRTVIDSFDTQQEVSEGSERIIRTSFTMSVNAYLLPEQYASTPNVKKTLTPKRVVWGVETDISGNVFTNPNLYNQYRSVLDFVAIRSSQRVLPADIASDSVTIRNVKVPILPAELIGSFDTANWFRVYINSEFKPSTIYTYVYDSSANTLIFTFTDLGFVLDGADEVDIVGKFEQL